MKSSLPRRQSGMTKTTYRGMIIEYARFPRNEFSESSSGQAREGYVANKNQL
ncbi:hypothetical protein [Pleomorphovibrio marinus]|uniref:hypothetical protein n=1 Tax=Pleomorphovibrio marinus TaxID=2164132 RepID=UPI001E482270|nr:hypothetical protein [Pleomorphovibrio marinus]